jgi:predicted metal-dependent hydrolase
MAKVVHLDLIGPVSLHKRRNNRYIRLSVSHEGSVKLTMPMWAPYKLGEAFLQRKKTWLLNQLKQIEKADLKDGDRIGKAHQIQVLKTPAKHLSTRLTNNQIVVSLPKGLSLSSAEVQKAIKAASHRALKKQAEQLLPIRLETLSKTSGFKYRSLKIRHLKSRWGSCSSNKDIVLSYYLMQLPWELIDYVILHELTHTKVMSHGQSFWTELEKHVAELKTKKQHLKKYRSTLLPKSLELAEA